MNPYLGSKTRLKNYPGQNMSTKLQPNLTFEALAIRTLGPCKPDIRAYNMLIRPPAQLLGLGSLDVLFSIGVRSILFRGSYHM